MFAFDHLLKQFGIEPKQITDTFEMLKEGAADAIATLRRIENNQNEIRSRLTEIERAAGVGMATSQMVAALTNSENGETQ